MADLSAFEQGVADLGFPLGPPKGCGLCAPISEAAVNEASPRCRAPDGRQKQQFRKLRGADWLRITE
jgi:hypothetical protein